jgi:2-isopropylmalate synthase
MSGQVRLYDTTLRDGAQREGISFTVTDKINIARKLEELGIDFIEGGWPGANPKDDEFFARSVELDLKRATLVAFGATRRCNSRVDEDAGLAALVGCGAPAVTIVGKASSMQVIHVLETSLEENLKMVTESIAFLKSNGIRVFFDAEHFFDGYKAEKEYSISVLKAAAGAGAECLVLCDTNGGTLPYETALIMKEAGQKVKAPLGIHAHNDAELAVAVTLMAVREGAVQVQGTINGYGERCGNANLCSVIPALKLKMGIDCISDADMAHLTDVSRTVSEISNLTPYPFMPYVGASAFSHKGGLHVSGMRKWTGAYQHIEPSKVGNRPRTLVSELAGRANILQRAKEIGVNLPPKGKEAQQLLDRVKYLESRGFQYENAQASFDLMVRRAQPGYKPPFELIDFMVVVEKSRRPGNSEHGEGMLSEAMVKVRVGGGVMHTAAEGDGPVNALDNALRKALLEFYPGLTIVKLVDYKVRILEESTGTESSVRVLIESSDGVSLWRTVGSSSNIIEASWLALADSLEYWLLNNTLET